MLTRRSYLLATSLAAAALLTEPNRARIGSLVANAKDTGVDPSAASAATAIRGFSGDMYRNVAAERRAKNVACSPFSVAMALAMTRTGARGTTASEMDAVLRAPNPAPQAFNAGLAALAQAVIAPFSDPAADGVKRPRLAIANSIWAQRDLPLEPAFVEALAKYYEAAVHAVDFKTATEAARLEINAWISERTNGKIPEVLSKDALTTMTRMVLANALYLKAPWRTPFNPRLTASAPFTREDGATVSATMMTAPGQTIGYQETPDWFAVELPYVGTQLAMTIVVPTPGRLAAVESSLDGALLERLLAGFPPTRVALRLPRWTFRLPVQLGPLLSRLGMPTAFDERLANFSGITSKAPLHIDKVVHETFIAVDEKGTEAAAATAVIIEAPSIPPPAIPVTVDRSFLYVIHHIAAATPLFVGRVIDPTVER